MSRAIHGKASGIVCYFGRGGYYMRITIEEAAVKYIADNGGTARIRYTKQG